MGFTVAVDIGGTFTDLVAYDRQTGEVRSTKSPTTYGALAEAIWECLRKVRIAPRDAEFVYHGTTLVINALIQRQGAKCALLTTRGFRDVIEIARGNRPDPFDLHYRRDEPLIPRELRFEIAERIAPDGSILTPLDETAIDTLAAKLREEGVEALAISFMNAYANPVHEERAAALFRERLPGLYVTQGTALSREWYEYERTATVAANAYVGPQVAGYIAGLEGELRDKGFRGTVFMMGSNGGVASTERATRQPILLVESGPIGGCIGAAAEAAALGFANVIAFDMGGTTAKCALVEDGRFSVDQIYYAGGYIKGFPIKSPVIDIIEVGSGGGSIAWLDHERRLHVGPRSAGSSPGPVAYGRGGTDPTVTDANLVLKRLDPARFLGGELLLDAAAARRAILTRIAEPLGYSGDQGVVDMADGIISIATVTMAGAIRRLTVEHGRDPRDFALFSYGGGGPLHASALARELSIPLVVVPPEPGNFSASGMAMADARLDTSQTFIGDLGEASLAKMMAAYAAMEAEARAAIEREIGPGEIVFERAAEMRYRGQRHNIKVAIGALSDPAGLREAFDRDYRRRYGHADTRAKVEVQALHLSAIARLDRPASPLRPRGEGRFAPRKRRVYFGKAAGELETLILDRAALAPGFSGEGPAIIEEYGSTTVILPGDRFAIGERGEIRILVGATSVDQRSMKGQAHG
ncbi:MAG TPA: hydantoinase/oxoprolinase family protein [Stellaceae bacterium]|nr:hydantoinase/oxoprolinase family protein [Stellaceae bacterium]